MRVVEGTIQHPSVFVSAVQSIQDLFVWTLELNKCAGNTWLLAVKNCRRFS